MEIVKFTDVKENIVSNFRKKMIIPIIGSGFTRGCRSSKGTVPSGSDYCEFMKKKIIEQGRINGTDLEKEKFPAISSIYHAEIPREDQKKYLYDHFTNVEIEQEKKEFLSIPWPYVYTLNTDDGIENNSIYNYVVYGNREIESLFFDEIISSNHCVIKIHGDIKEILTYKDSSSEVFDESQYVLSIKQSKELLDRLSHDMSFQNIIYVGCSLDDEIDLLYSSIQSYPNITAKYYCTVGNPSYIDQLKFKKYGITHCIVFDNYSEIFECFVEASKEAEKIPLCELENYKLYTFSRLDSDYEKNKAYLFWGKSLINKDKTITLPSFYISREITDSIVKRIDKNRIQIVLGRSCSGKSYLMIDMVLKVRDRDVYAFSSKDSISKEVLENLLQRSNSLIIADSNSLTIEQIEVVLRSKDLLEEKHTSFIIIEQKSNRDLDARLTLLDLNGIIKKTEIPIFDISNKLSPDETRCLNEKLVESSLAVFSNGKTIVDNIIASSKVLLDQNKFSNIMPKSGTVREIGCLIALATEVKIYSSKMVNLDLVAEFATQAKAANPLIEEEQTWSYEVSSAHNSSSKYIVNAEYWLYNQLDEISKDKTGYDLIVQAYQFIIHKMVQLRGKPDLMQGEKGALYKPYILFDKINMIFSSQDLKLCRDIYENLNALLSTDPNYMHQRAKCYIRSAKREMDKSARKLFLEKAYRDASISNEIFSRRNEKKENDKTQISIAHTQYTKALALCHLIISDDFCDKKSNSETISNLHLALISPYNSYSFAKKDIDNYGNAISKCISHLATNVQLIDKKVEEKLSDLIVITMGE